MFLKKAELFQFRNYDSLCLDFDKSINVFIGENGAGKSSFLEALYCALRGKSFHPFVSDQFIQRNKENSKVSLTLKEEEGCSHLESSFFLSDFRLKKEFSYCGKKKKASFFLEKFPCFIFTENSMKSLRQGHAERRAFVESLFFSNQQNQAKKSFEQLLKQKNKLLKNYKKGLLSRSDFLSFLSALNKKFLASSFDLVEARLELLYHLYSVLPQISSSFFKDPGPFLSFSYFTEGNKLLKRGEDIFSILKEELEQKKEQEIQAGTCLSGPQRHEIKFLFDEEDSKLFCSKGQQRSYVLSLLLSHIHAFPQVFLFLDDVLLELDENIQKKFLTFLEKKNCQIFLTSCNIISFRTEKMSIFFVKEGQIKRL